MTDEARGQTRSAVVISNRQSLLRLEIAVTSRKQSLRADSNRHNRDALASLPRNFRTAALVLRQFLTATRPNLITRTTT